MTIGATLPTLLDFAKREDMRGKIMPITEVIEPSQEWLQDIPWMEGNLATGHKTTVRTGYPEPTWRVLNYGVQPTKGTTTQIVDTCGMLEAYGEVDKELADLNGNKAEWFMGENAGHLTGMGSALATAMIYGDQSIDPEKITGFMPRLSVPSAVRTNAGYNMIDGGAADGQTDCLSMLLIGWGQNSVHGIYSNGSAAGFSMRDLGEQTILDANGGRFQAYRHHFQWKVGLCVRDWNFTARICNIDSSALTRDAATGAQLLDLMAQAEERVNVNSGAKFTWLVPRKIKSYLRSHMVANVKAGGGLTYDNVNGRSVLALNGIPIRKVDAMTTETAILDAAGSFADV